jgi:hypothetical protein
MSFLAVTGLYTSSPIIARIRLMTPLPRVGRPAERALRNAGYLTLESLGGAAEQDLLRLHGFGPRGISLLRDALQAAGLPPLRAPLDR